MQDIFKFARVFALPEQCVLEIVGDDARAFAQAQFMNDLRPLRAGEWQWNGWLDAKGRVQALFALHMEHEQRLLAALRMAPATAEPVVALLRRYVLRSKVRLQLRDDFMVAGAFAGDVGASAPALALPGTPARTLLILPAPVRDDTELALRWQQADIEAGLPWLPAESVGAFTPQMLSLHRWAAYSVNKGCYPGQEVVARTHYLGQAKRRLLRVASAAALPPGTAIEADGRSVGNMVCSCRAGNGYAGLAVFGGEVLEALSASGQALTVEPLPEPAH